MVGVPVINGSFGGGDCGGLVLSVVVTLVLVVVVHI